MKINALLKKYQKLLKLDGWQIDLEVVHAMDAPGKVGTCTYILDKERAQIAMLSEEQHKAMADTQEATLVHELVHLIVTPYFRDPASEHEYQLQEQAIERLVHAIINSK